MEFEEFEALMDSTIEDGYTYDEAARIINH